MYVLNPHLLLLQLSQVFLRLQSSHASSTGTGNGLAVSLVLNITSGKHTGDARLRGAGLGDDVALGVDVDLALDQVGGGVVADGIEEAVCLDRLLLAADDVLDDEVAHQALVVALDLCGDGVEAHRHLGVLEQPRGHGLAGTQLVTTHQHGNVRTVLCQKGRLLGRGITAANDKQRLVAEDGHGAVAHGAGGDAVLPVLVLAGEVEAARRGAGRDDDGVGGVGLVRVELCAEGKGPLGEVQLGDGVGDDFGAEALRLGAHAVHELLAHDALGEAGEVFDFGRGGELAAGGGAVGHEAFVEDGCLKGQKSVYVLFSGFVVENVRFSSALAR